MSKVEPIQNINDQTDLSKLKPGHIYRWEDSTKIDSSNAVEKNKYGIPKPIEHEVITKDQAYKYILHNGFFLKLGDAFSPHDGTVSTTVFNSMAGEDQTARLDFYTGLEASSMTATNAPIGYEFPDNIKDIIKKYCLYTKYKAVNRAPKKSVKEVLQEAKNKGLKIKGPMKDLPDWAFDGDAPLTYHLIPTPKNCYIAVMTDNTAFAEPVGCTTVKKQEPSFWHPFKGKTIKYQVTNKIPSDMDQLGDKWGRELRAYDTYSKENKYERML